MSSTDSAATQAPVRSITEAKHWLRSNQKLVRFILIGALGCLGGALVGELLLAAVRPVRPAAPRQQICLVIDTSSSMLMGDPFGESGSANKLEEVKAAAAQFLARQHLSRDRIALVAFHSRAQILSPLGQDGAALRAAMANLRAIGNTAMHAGLDAAAQELAPNREPGAPSDTLSILLFTDGQPNNPVLTLVSARACREQGIRIVAIGAGEADTAYLAEVTGDPALVFAAQSGSFGESFKQAEAALRSGSLVETSLNTGVVRSWLQTIGWTSLLACGLSLALVGGQNRYLKRSIFTRQEALVAGLGGLVAGATGGAAGQLLFVTTGAAAQLPWVGATIVAGILLTARVLGWAILGALLGRGLALFVPNLAPRRALIGGALGGAAGAIGFLLASLLGDGVGRLLGAAILGGFVGMMIALVEAAFRQAWLEVRFGLKETIQVTLGATPVKIGSDSRSCTVYAREAPPLAVAYRFENGQVHCVDYATESSTLVNSGDERTIGNLTVTVRTSASATALSTSPPSGQVKVPPAPAPPPKAPRSGGPPPTAAPVSSGIVSPISAPLAHAAPPRTSATLPRPPAPAPPPKPKPPVNNG